MRVSIITPSFNQGEFIEETIRSVLNQTYSNIQYIVIDGGSTDKTIEIIKKYSAKIDFWISEKDDGQADAINKGMKKANGELICWINSDDLLYPNFVEKRVSEFKNNPTVDFIYGDVDQGINVENCRIRKGAQTNYTKMLATLNVPIPQQATMWRKSVINKIGFLEKKWHVLLDREFFMRVFLNSKTLYIEGSLAFFRNHENSKSIAESEKWANELIIYYNELFSEFRVNKLFRGYKKLAYSNLYYECSKIYMNSNDKIKGKIFKKLAFKTYPLNILKKEIIKMLVLIKKKIIN